MNGFCSHCGAVRLMFMRREDVAPCVLALFDAGVDFALLAPTELCAAEALERERRRRLRLVKPTEAPESDS